MAAESAPKPTFGKTKLVAACVAGAVMAMYLWADSKPQIIEPSLNPLAWPVYCAAALNQGSLLPPTFFRTLRSAAGHFAGSSPYSSRRVVADVALIRRACHAWPGIATGLSAGYPDPVPPCARASLAAAPRRSPPACLPACRKPNFLFSVPTALRRVKNASKSRRQQSAAKRICAGGLPIRLRAPCSAPQCRSPPSTKSPTRLATCFTASTRGLSARAFRQRQRRPLPASQTKSGGLERLIGQKRHCIDAVRAAAGVSLRASSTAAR